MPTVSMSPLFAHQYVPILLLEQDQYDYVLQFAARGSGKSTGINQFAVQESLRLPGNVGIIGRRSEDDAINLDYTQFLREVPDEFLVGDRKAGLVRLRPADWDGKDMSKVSTIHFIGAMSGGRQNPDKMKGEFGWIAFTELSEMDENVFMQAKTSCRMPGMRRKGLFASNLVPRFHWIWNHFGLDDEIPEESFCICQDEKSPLYGFLISEGEAEAVPHERRPVYRGKYGNHATIWSKTSDNKALPKDYVEKTFANMPAGWIAKFIEGKTGFEPDGKGVHEKQWRTDVHVKDVEIADVPVTRSFDPGLYPAVTWGQFVCVDGLWERRTLLECVGFDVHYPDFLMEAMSRQRELFGSTGTYINCGDPSLASTSAQTHRSYLDQLRDADVDRVRMETSTQKNSKIYRVELQRQWLTVSGHKSRYYVHPRCEVLIEGMEGGYKRKWNQAGSKLVEEPVKDNYYSGVQDCEQYSLVNFGKMDGDVRSSVDGVKHKVKIIRGRCAVGGEQEKKYLRVG